MSQKISKHGSKSKNRSRPFTSLFIFSFVAKNRLLISAKTAALCDPQKNGNLKEKLPKIFWNSSIFFEINNTSKLWFKCHGLYGPRLYKSDTRWKWKHYRIDEKIWEHNFASIRKKFILIFHVFFYILGLSPDFFRV